MRSTMRLAVGIVALALCAPASPALGYAEDYQDHSTFHYELTRAFAYGAGFTRDEADLIALADQATDSGTVTSDTGSGLSVTITGTERDDLTTARYWHFARRAASPTVSGASYPGSRATCRYFVGTADSCPASGPELSAIEQWAVAGGTGTLSQGMALSTVTITRAGVATTIDWAPGTDDRDQRLVALGLSLHSLADSYSHEACMRVAHLRGHFPAPDECTAVAWHENLEYGDEPLSPGGAGDEGVPYTREAATGVWGFVKLFRASLGSAGTATMTDASAADLVDAFVHAERADDRAGIANARYPG